jgi:hypothetical protein
VDGDVAKRVRLAAGGIVVVAEAKARPHGASDGAEGETLRSCRAIVVAGAGVAGLAGSGGVAHSDGRLPIAAEKTARLRGSARRRWDVGIALELAFAGVARHATVEATLGSHSAGIHHDLDIRDLALADGDGRFSIAESCLGSVERLDLEGGFTTA